MECCVPIMWNSWYCVSIFCLSSFFILYHPNFLLFSEQFLHPLSSKLLAVFRAVSSSFIIQTFCCFSSSFSILYHPNFLLFSILYTSIPLLYFPTLVITINYRASDLSWWFVSPEYMSLFWCSSDSLMFFSSGLCLRLEDQNQIKSLSIFKAFSNTMFLIQIVHAPFPTKFLLV